MINVLYDKRRFKGKEKFIKRYTLNKKTTKYWLLE